MNRIPKNIHLTFLNKQEPFPSLFTTCLETIKSMHPGWNIRVYNEDDAHFILSTHFPQVLNIYYAYPHTVQRSDILRVLLVYLYGGFYMDLDMLCLKPLDTLRGFKLILGEEKTITQEETSQLGLQHSLRIANYMFGGVAKHPFWHAFLNEAILKSYLPVRIENDILESTGPGLLTNIYHSYKKYYPEITLLRNTDRCCLRPGHSAVSCHFGNFAAHLHQGSWRWGTTHSTKNIASTSLKRKSAQKPLFPQPPKNTFGFALLPFAGRFLHPNNTLHDLYKRFSAYKKSRANMNHLSGATTITFGNPSSYVHRLSPGNKNVLITSWDVFFEQCNPAETINQSYSCCIVPHTQDKKLFLQAGIKVPVYVVATGFKKPRRNFDTESEMFFHFTVGFSGTYSEKDLSYIITACHNIKSNWIPELRLQLLQNQQSINVRKVAKSYVHNSTSWINTSSNETALSEWYNSIHCYISINEKDALYNGPATSLYMGVPTIIAKNPTYSSLANSGFYKIIPSGQQIITIDSIEKSIRELYAEYIYYSELTLHGAAWIEDRWSDEKSFHEIINLLTTK